jgi:hypothetical protein
MTYEDAETLFDLMELYREEHPDATDDECFEAVCAWNIDRAAARIDALKERRHDRSIYAS